MKDQEAIKAFAQETTQDIEAPVDSETLDYPEKELYARLLSRVRSTLGSKGCSDPGSHSFEVAQQTWASALKNLHQVRNDISHWTYAIGQNTAYHHLRICIQEQQFHEQLDDTFNLGEEPTIDYNQIYENAILLEEILQKAEKIDPLFAQILTMRFVEDYDFDEIACRLDRPLANVRAAYYRGIVRLKQWQSRLNK